MRPFTITLLTLVSAILLFAATNAQEPKPAAAKAHESQSKSIVPLVTLKPGETRELLLTTPCTVGLTRGGGFSLAEMKEGKPAFENPTLRGNRIYAKDGLTMTVADYKSAIEFAESEQFRPLKDAGLNAFTVTISADDDATPGVTDMHLLDATCNGHCTTDFRVLVVKP